MRRVDRIGYALCGAFVLLASGARAEKPAEAEPSARKLVIASFAGDAGEQARRVALDVVAGRTDRTDYAVVGQNDVDIVAKRLGVASDSDKGRELISAELGIDLWLDGELDGGGAGELRLVTSEGEQLARLALEERDAQRALAVLREKIWPWLGAHVSEQERVARKLEHERERARAKVAAREQELVRQRQLVIEREERRLDLLEAARALARKKEQARQQELAHQAQLVRERRLAQAREEQRKREELQRALALEAERKRRAEQAALAQQRAAAQAARARQAQSAQPGWQYAPAQQAQQPAPASTWQAQRWQRPPQQPSATSWQASPPGQWQQPEPAASSSQAPGAQPAAAPAPEEVPIIEGVSPEVRAWLERRQRQRAAGH